MVVLLLSPHLTSKFRICELGLHREWALTFVIAVLLQGYDTTRVNLCGCVIDWLLLALCFLVVANHVDVCIEKVLMADLHPDLAILSSLLGCSHLQLFFEILKRVVFEIELLTA